MYRGFRVSKVFGKDGNPSIANRNLRKALRAFQISKVRILNGFTAGSNAI